jgi:hypothetical protein
MDSHLLMAGDSTQKTVIVPNKSRLVLLLEITSITGLKKQWVAPWIYGRPIEKVLLTKR